MLFMDWNMITITVLDKKKKYEEWLFAVHPAGKKFLTWFYF